MVKSIIATLLLLSSLCHGQQIQFAEKVDGNGRLINASKYYIINKHGGSLACKITLPNGLKTSKVRLDLFLVLPNKKTVFENSILQEVRKEWNWLSTDIIFYKAGTYNIYLYDDKDLLLKATQLHITIK